MKELLDTVMMFNCKDCECYWSLEEFSLHKVEGWCIKDPLADNLIQSLAVRDKFKPEETEILVEPISQFNGLSFFFWAEEKGLLIEHFLDT